MNKNQHNPKQRINLKWLLFLFLFIITDSAINAQVTVTKSELNNLTSKQVDQPFTYVINYSTPNTSTSYTNLQICDQLPQGLVFLGVSAATGDMQSLSYNSNSNSVCAVFNSPWNGGTGQFQIVVKFAPTVFNGTVASNTATVSSDQYNGTSNTVNITAISSNTPPVLTSGVLIDKVASSTNVYNNGLMLYALDYGIGGLNAVSSLNVVDPLPNGFVLTQISAGIYNGTNVPFNVYYKTNINSSYTLLPGSPYNSGTGVYRTIDFLPANVRITEIKVEYPSLPAGALFTKENFRSLDISGYFNNSIANLSSGSTVQNCGTITATGTGAGTATDCVNSIYQSGSYLDVGVGKAKTDYGVDLEPGGTYRYFIAVGDGYNNSADIVNPVIADLLPPEFIYVGNVTVSGTGFPTGSNQPITTVIPNFNGTGRTLVRWAWGASNPLTITRSGSSKSFQIRFDIQVRSVPTGTYRNDAFVSVQGTPNKWSSYNVPPVPIIDTFDFDGDGNTTETIVNSYVPFNVINPSGAALVSEKWVKGSLDAGYSRYPASGRTTPGGMADYKLKLKNAGTVALKNIKIIDIFPYVGDRGVIDLSARGSQWQPMFVGPVIGPAGSTVYYSTSYDPCRTDINFTAAGCDAGAVWTTTLPTDITTVHSIKIDLGSIVIQPNDSLEFNWPMRVPIDAPTNGEIAWNSFGYTATRNDNNSVLPSSEPIKVGISLNPMQPAAYGNYTWYDANGDGLQNEPTSNGINGIKVDLYWAKGSTPNIATDSLVTFTITSSNAGNPGYYLFPVLNPGNYYAVFHKPVNNLRITTPNVGSDNTINSDGIQTIISGDTLAITAITNLTAGETDYTWDLGLSAACTKPNAGSDISVCGISSCVNLTGTNTTGGTWTAMGTNPAGATLGSTTGGVAQVCFTQPLPNTSIYNVYSFIYTVGTCTDTVNVTVYSKPNAGNDTAVCNTATGYTHQFVYGAWHYGGWSALASNPSGLNFVQTGSATWEARFTNAATGVYGFVVSYFSCTDTMYITVKRPTTSTTNLSVCDVNLPYTWNGLTFNVAGTQTAHLTNAAGCDSAATLNLTVVNCAITVTNTCPVNTVNLNTHVDSTSKPTGTIVSWHTSEPAADSNRVANPTAVGAGVYYAAYWDVLVGCYSPVSVSVTVTITPCCPANPPALTPTSVAVCYPLTINLNSLAITSTTQAGERLVFSTHNPPNNNNDTLTTAQASTVTSGMYYAFYKNIYCFGSADSVQVTINPKPNAGADHFIECGSGKTVDTLKPTTPLTGTWLAMAGNPTGVTMTNIANGHAALTLPVAPTTGTWRFIYTLPTGCTDTVNVVIGVSPTPSIVVNMGSNPICKNGTVQLCPTPWGWSNYQWYKNGVAVVAPTGTGSCITLDSTGIGSYTLAATNGAGCWSAQSNPTVVTYNNACTAGPCVCTVSASFTINKTSQCVTGNVYSFTSNVTGAKGILKYTWNFGDGTTSNAANPTHTYATAGDRDVTLVVIDSISPTCKCTTYANAQQIYVGAAPVAAFTVSSNGCTRNFNSTSTISAGYIANYYWDLGNGTTSTSSNPSVTYTAGTYTVKLVVTGNFGCKDSTTQTITIAPGCVVAPACSASWYSQNATSNCDSTLTFIANGSNGVGTIYTWNFGDGATAAGTPATHKYATTGAFMVKLVVANGACRDSVSYNVYINSCSVTSGGSGGVESKTLGSVMAQRLYGNAKASTTETNGISNGIKFTHSGVHVDGVNAFSLSDLMPTVLAGTDFPYVSTPTDLVNFTNAVEVLAIDYTKNNNIKAVAFGTKTLGDVYSHTKPICDRLKGAVLQEVKTINVNGYNLMAYKVQQCTGEIEYAMNLSAGTATNRNSISLQSNWFTNSYVQDENLYNFQLWAVSYDMVKSMATDIIAKLQANGIVNAVTATDLPKAYVTSGNRKANTVTLNITNNTNATTAVVELKEKATETAQETTRQIPVTIQPLNSSTVTIDVKDSYEATINLIINNSKTDMLYLNDGTWAIDYNKNNTTLQYFDVVNETNATTVTNDDYRLLRNVNFSATTKDYVTAYKTIGTKCNALDLSNYNSIMFKAIAQGASSVTITLISSNITNWNDQYTTTINLDGRTEDYVVALNSFHSSKYNTSVSGNSITGVSFAFTTGRGVQTNMTAALSNVRFSFASAATQDNSLVLGIYPNPNTGKFTATFNSDASQSLVLKVVDIATGRVVKTQFINATRGSNKQVIELNNNYTSGNYIVTLEGDDVKYTPVKLIVTK